MLPFKGNPAPCPACGGHFPFTEGLAVGMPMRKLEPGHIAICVDCWSLSTSDDGETLRVFAEKDIDKMGRETYGKVRKMLDAARLEARSN